MPRPAPMTRMPGRTWPTYDVSTPMLVSVSRPTAASSMPPPISGRGPIFGSSFVDALVGADDDRERHRQEREARTRSARTRAFCCR